MAEFVAALDPVNELADQAPGFVWRLQDEDGNATSIRAFDDDRIIVNIVRLGVGRPSGRLRLPQRSPRGDAPPPRVVRADSDPPGAVVGPGRSHSVRAGGRGT